MKVLNKMSKGLFYALLGLYIIGQSYGLSLLVSGALLSAVFAIWTIIKPLPSLVTDKLWLIYFLSGVPFGVGIMISMLVDLIKSRKKSEQDNEQDNGNH